MIIGNFTDLHARADTPQGRTDNFRQSILTKLEEIGQLWKDNQVELVTFTGDLFDSPDPASSIRNDVIAILKSWQLPIVGVVGSHDYFGYQMKTLKRTALGSLYYSGLIQLVGGKGQPEYLKFVNDKKEIVITGSPHTYWATDDPTYISKPRFEEGLFQLQLVHCDLIDKKVPWQHLLVTDIVTESDLVMVGHYHPGWEVPIISGNKKTMFVNQGSIGRIEATKRTPRVCIIKVENSMPYPYLKGYSVKYLSLQNALEYPFKEKEVELVEGTSSQDVTKLLQMLETSEIEISDIKAVLPNIAKEFNYSKEVLEKAFELLEKV